jgi:hypothetical protein
MQLWRYLHFKWMYFNVIWIAKHTETFEEMVIYEHIDKNQWLDETTLRVRPKKMFEDNVIIDGKTIPRFKYVW